MVAPAGAVSATVALIVTVAVAPAASWPSVKSSALPAELSLATVAPETLMLPKTRFAESVSSTRMSNAVAEVAPAAFVMVSVYCTASPASAPPVTSVFTSESAGSTTVSVCVEAAVVSVSAGLVALALFTRVVPAWLPATFCASSV